jgi:hypothetical protein
LSFTMLAVVLIIFAATSRVLAGLFPARAEPS